MQWWRRLRLLPSPASFGKPGPARRRTQTRRRRRNPPPTPSHPKRPWTWRRAKLNAIKIEPVETYIFPVERTAVGSIDYDEDLSVQVFSPYQGKIITAFANLGDEVQKGQPLYTIDSPDLIQAESTLIGAAATFDSDQQRTGARQGPLRNQRSFRTRDGTGDLRSTDGGRRPQSGAGRGPRLRQDRGRN